MAIPLQGGSHKKCKSPFPPFFLRFPPDPRFFVFLRLLWDAFFLSGSNTNLAVLELSWVVMSECRISAETFNVSFNFKENRLLPSVSRPPTSSTGVPLFFYPYARPRRDKLSFRLASSASSFWRCFPAAELTPHAFFGN